MFFLVLACVEMVRGIQGTTYDIHLSTEYPPYIPTYDMGGQIFTFCKK